MRIKARYVTLVRTGYRLLGLHDLEVIRNACGETILCLGQGLLREINRTASHFYLICGSIKIQQRVTHIIVDLRAEILEALFRLT